ncbi:MAG: thiol-disulfide oxidoreductase DCC family protein [Bacteroidia bacterium]
MVEPKAILFYDGKCALCNFSVKLALKNLKSQEIYFAPLQGLTAKQTKKLPKDTKSVVLFVDNVFYTKSTAVFKILAQTKIPLKWLYVFSFLPKVLTDCIYDVIAKYRYKIFGEYNTCPMPPLKYRHLFLD